MTMVTIVRPSNSNVEAVHRGGGETESEQEEVWGYSSSTSTKDIDREGSGATGQKGRKQACMWVSDSLYTESVGGGVRKLWSWVLIAHWMASCWARKKKKLNGKNRQRKQRGKNFPIKKNGQLLKNRAAVVRHNGADDGEWHTKIQRKREDWCWLMLEWGRGEFRQSVECCAARRRAPWCEYRLGQLWVSLAACWP